MKAKNVATGILALLLCGGIGAAGFFVAKDVKASQADTPPIVQEQKEEWEGVYAAIDSPSTFGGMTANATVAIVTKGEIILTLGLLENNEVTYIDDNRVFEAVYPKNLIQEVEKNGSRYDFIIETSGEIFRDLAYLDETGFHFADAVMQKVDKVTTLPFNGDLGDLV